MIIRPTGVDQRKLRPQVMLHVHLSHEALLAYTCGKPGLVGGVGRFEGVGPITLGQVRRFLADTACEVKVQPVIDPQDTPPVDGYEIPRRIREAMFLRVPASCFPYAAGAQRMDLDHTTPYIPLARGGPPGQTGVHNLGPMSRLEHRVKTHSRWQVRQPEPGVWIWRSPHRAYYLVTNAGTQYLGEGSFARRVWKAAAEPRAVPPSRPRRSTARAGQAGFVADLMEKAGYDVKRQKVNYTFFEEWARATVVGTSQDFPSTYTNGEDIATMG